jgi:site-specific DNA recombinase
VPRIVSDALWQLANDQLNENRKKFYRQAKREYLLRGRIRCGVCGRPMSGSGGNYRCPVRDGANYSNDPAHVCNNRRVPYEYVDAATWSTVREALLDEEKMWSAVNRRTADMLKVRETLEMSLTALQARAQKERDKTGRLLDLYAAGDIDRALYLAKCKTIEDGIAALAVQIQDLERRLAERPVILPEQEQALRAFQREVVSRMTDDVSVQEKRKLIDLLRVEATWNGLTRQLTITGLIINSVLKMSPA